MNTGGVAGRLTAPSPGQKQDLLDFLRSL